MPDRSTKNSIPNNTNIFEVFRDYVESFQSVSEVMMKGGLDKKTIKYVTESSDLLLKSVDHMIPVIDSIAKFTIGNKGNIESNTRIMVTTFISLTTLVTELNKIKILNIQSANLHVEVLDGLVLRSQILIQRLSVIPPDIKGGDGIRNFTTIIRDVISITNDLSRLNFIKMLMAKKSVQHLYVLLFGKKNKNIKGLFDIFIKIGKQPYNKSNINDGIVFLTIIENPIKGLQRVVNTLALMLPAALVSLITLPVLKLVILGLTDVLIVIGKKEKVLRKSSKVISDVSKTILIMSGALVAFTLASMIVVSNFKAVGITLLFMVGLISIFILVGNLSKSIEKGGKELLYIAAAVGILALTASIMGLVGKYLVANWKGFAITFAFIGILVLSFIGIGLAARWINNGGKELLYIAAIVGILAVMAVILVVVGNYLTVNWEGLLAIGLMMGFLVGLFVGIAYASKVINKSLPGLIAMVLGTILMSTSIYILSKVANTTDMDKLAITVGLMCGIMVAVFGMMITLAAISSTGVGAVALAIGAAIMGAITVIVVSMAKAIKTIAEAAKLIDEIGVNNSSELADKLMLPIEALITKGKSGKSLFEMIASISGKGLIKTAIKIKALKSIAGDIGGMALIMKNIASLNVPDPQAGYDQHGNPKAYRPMSQQDFIDAATNSATILTLFAHIFDDDKYILPNGVIVGGMKNSFGNIKKSARRKVRTIRKVVEQVGIMADVCQRLASLSIPDKFDEKTGKPTHYKQMEAGEFKKASTNVATIITTLAGAFNDEGLQVTLKEMSIIRSARLKSIMESVKPVSDLVDIITKLAGGQYVKTWKKDEHGNNVPDTYGSFLDLLNDTSGIQKNITRIVSVVLNSFTEIDKDTIKAAKSNKKILKITKTNIETLQIIVDFYKGNLENLNVNKLQDSYNGISGLVGKIFTLIDGTTIDKKGAETIRLNIQETTNLMKQINNTDVNKLKYAFSLMSKLNELSRSLNGNFKDLAKAIDEDLVNALEKLQKTLDQIKEGGNTEIKKPEYTNDLFKKPSGSERAYDLKVNSPIKPQQTITSEDITDLKNSINEIKRILQQDTIKVRDTSGTLG